MIKQALIVFILMGGVVGCSEVRPFVDSRREAGQVQPVGQSRPDRIAVCYNPIWDSDAQIEAPAEAACAEQGKQAVRLEQETKYFNCRLVTPNTAFFACR